MSRGDLALQLARLEDENARLRRTNLEICAQRDALMGRWTKVVIQPVPKIVRPGLLRGVLLGLWIAIAAELAVAVLRS